MRYSILSLVRLAACGVAAYVIITIGLRVHLQVKTFFHNFDQHAGVVLHQSEVVRNYEAKPGFHQDEAVVPRVLHHIFHNWTDPQNEVLPPEYSQRRQSCMDMTEGWEHWLWSAERSREFIADEYPWFLHTYDNFRMPIQRVDTLRYFLIRHYGGIYLDLDNPCLTSLEPLRYYPAWVVDGGAGSLSNDGIAGQPNHPFWIMLTNSIISYAWNYPLPFLTISYATGQWFETEIWEKYHAQLPATERPLTRILTDAPPGDPETIFFFRDEEGGGGTWTNWDNIMFDWIAYHNTEFISIIVLVVGALLVGLLFLVRRCRASRSNVYQKV